MVFSKNKPQHGVPLYTRIKFMFSKKATFMFSKKATKIDKIIISVKLRVKILSIFVAFLENINFNLKF